VTFYLLASSTRTRLAPYIETYVRYIHSSRLGVSEQHSLERGHRIVEMQACRLRSGSKSEAGYGDRPATSPSSEGKYFLSMPVLPVYLLIIGKDGFACP